MSNNRRSVISASHIEVSATNYENNFITLNVKKDDFNWSLKKQSSELIFFRNTILDVALRFNNSFPVLNEDNKELLSELSDWLKECADAMNYSSSHSGIFNSFVKVNEYTSRSENDKDRLKNTDGVDNIYRRDPVKHALRNGYLLMSHAADHEHGSGHHHHRHHDDDDSSTINGMKKKYFSLCDHLNYYENESAYLAKDEPEGIIKLDTYYVTKLAGDDDLDDRNGNEFTLFSFSPYTIKYTLRASNNDEMEAWCATLSTFPCMI